MQDRAPDPKTRSQETIERATRRTIPSKSIQKAETETPRPQNENPKESETQATNQEESGEVMKGLIRRGESDVEGLEGDERRGEWKKERESYRGCRSSWMISRR